MVAEPSAFGEVQEELAAFSLVQALEVKLQLDDDRAHGSMALPRLLALFPDGSVLCLPGLVVHALLYHVSAFTPFVSGNSSPPYRGWSPLADSLVEYGYGIPFYRI